MISSDYFVPLKEHLRNIIFLIRVRIWLATHFVGDADAGQQRGGDDGATHHDFGNEDTRRNRQNHLSASWSQRKAVFNKPGLVMTKVSEGVGVRGS